MCLKFYSQEFICPDFNKFISMWLTSVTGTCTRQYRIPQSKVLRRNQIHDT